MKKVFAFALFAVILTACDNTAKYKPMIEEVSSDWDNMTTQVTEFSSKIMDEQANLMNLKNNMQVAPEKMENWPETAQTQYSNIQAATQTSTNNLQALSAEVDAFLTSWQEKSEELNELKSEMETGDLEGDVESEVSSLSAAVTDASAKLDTWRTKFDEIKASASNAQRMFADFAQSHDLGDVR